MTRDQMKRRFNIVGESRELNRAVEVAMQVAPTEVTVLVHGENGTGKDVFSKIIHQLSLRKHKPFIAINCGAIPEGTIDSELFGHEKGSFTSAYDSRKGYFEETNGGVIFLDEIAEMPMPTQARLLRVLENGEYLRVGSSKVLKTDVRVVAATNRNLIDQIRNAKFREDLYFRLNTISIYVPPLRDRGEDIELLFRYFAAEFAQRYGRQPLRLAPDAVPVLYQYHWPGNVRELRNFAEKVTVLNRTEVLAAEEITNHLPLAETRLPVLARPFARQNTDEHPNNGRSARHQEANPNLNTEFVLRVLYELKNEISEIKYALNNLMKDGAAVPTGFPAGPMVAPTPPTAYGSDVILRQPAPYRNSRAPVLDDDEELAHVQVVDENLSLEQREMDLINKALQKHHQNRKKAATELGISERTLYRKIKSYGLDK